MANKPRIPCAIFPVKRLKKPNATSETLSMTSKIIPTKTNFSYRFDGRLLCKLSCSIRSEFVVESGEPSSEECMMPSSSSSRAHSQQKQAQAQLQFQFH